MSIDKAEYDIDPTEKTLVGLLLERQQTAGTPAEYLAQTDTLFQNDPKFRPIYLQLMRLSNVYGTSALAGNPINADKALGFLQGALLAAPIGLEYSNQYFVADWHNGMYRQLSDVQNRTHRMAVRTQAALLNAENAEKSMREIGMVFDERKYFVTEPGDAASRMSGLIEALLEDEETQSMYFHEEFEELLTRWAPHITDNERVRQGIDVGFGTVVTGFFKEVDEREARADAKEEIIQQRHEEDMRIAAERELLGKLDFKISRELK